MRYQVRSLPILLRANSGEGGTFWARYGNAHTDGCIGTPGPDLMPIQKICATRNVLLFPGVITLIMSGWVTPLLEGEFRAPKLLRTCKHPEAHYVPLRAHDFDPPARAHERIAGRQPRPPTPPLPREGFKPISAVVEWPSIGPRAGSVWVLMTQQGEMGRERQCCRRAPCPSPNGLSAPRSVQ